MRWLALIVASSASVLLLLLAGAPPAAAVPVTGTAVGYRSTSGWWIGSWALADGTRGLCVTLGAQAPTGHDADPVDAAGLGWYSDDDRARLAYISRAWAQSDDPTTAAAAQLATWQITGMNDATPESLAARAGAAAPAVLERSRQMRAEIDGEQGASRSVQTRLELGRDDSGATTVTADLQVDFLSAPATVAAGRHEGTITLDGAVFADGSNEQHVVNGTAYRIMPTATNAVASFSASAVFDHLPYGDALTIGRTVSGVQSVLVAPGATASGRADASTERPSPLPFQPSVVTRASTQTAAPGAAVTDALEVSVAPSHDAGESSEWGVFGADGGPYSPIQVTVRSRLLGPFDSVPAAADQAPADAPVVCEVTTLIDHGPGSYTTAPCTLPAAGHYVWTETISADDTPADQGRERVKPWTSRFGEVQETVLVTAPVVGRAELAATGSDLSGAAPASAAAAAGVLAGLLLVRRRSLRRRRRDHA